MAKYLKLFHGISCYSRFPPAVLSELLNMSQFCIKVSKIEMTFVIYHIELCTYIIPIIFKTQKNPLFQSR